MTHARDLKVGDFFIERLSPHRIYAVTGWYKGRVGGCPLAQGLDGAPTMFAGCSEPYGPFETLEEAVRAREGL